MCGIFAIIPVYSASKIEIVEMSEKLSHRGPDGEGIFIIEKLKESNIHKRNKFQVHNLESIKLLESELECELILGHRRLSIIDLSRSGDQPMSFLDRYWIVFNGEIYNYIEVRNKLMELGYNFKTNSDTEVILAAFHHWGQRCQEEFNGMWAFIIYDSLNGSLFISRDRFGVKPLYYYVSENGVAFASEIKAFTALTSWKFSVNEKIILDYLVWNIQDHTDETFFEGVFQVPQGSFIQYNLNSKKNETTHRSSGYKLLSVKWYNLEDKLIESSFKYPEKKMNELLFSAVDLELRSDVKVGACLSGGIDSSSIAAVIGNNWDINHTGKFNTLTAGSVVGKFDEREFAHRINRLYHFESNEVVVNDKDLFEELDKIIWHQDEPFGSTSTYAQYKVFEKAQALGLKVMLDGQGSDEVFYGYPGFYGPYLASLLMKFRLVNYIKNVWNMYRKNNISLFKILGYTIGYIFPSSIRLISRFDGKAFADLSWLNKNYRKLTDFDLFSRFRARRSPKHMSLAMIQHTNLPMLLHWEDRNSMAYSVEARVPFLDHRIVEFGFNLDDKFKIGNGITKKVLRDAMVGLVPDEILGRRDKMGFVTAEAEWMKGELVTVYRDEIRQSLENFSKLLNPNLLIMFDEYCEGKRSYNNLFWRVICLNRWFNLFKKS